jgi:signal transduction histidine kinase
VLYFSIALLTVYFFEIRELFSLNLFPERGVPASGGLVMVLIASGLLMTRVDRGFMRTLVSPTDSGVAARHLAFTTFISPLFVGIFFSYLIEKGYLIAPVGFGAATTTVLTVIFGLLWKTTVRLERAEDELRELNRDLEMRVRLRTAQLEASNLELEAFSYSASHVLKGPLRAVDGFSRILMDEYAERLDSNGRRLLGVIRDGAIQMGQLLDDTVAFVQISRLEMKEDVVDIAELAREAFDMLMASAFGRDVRMEVGPLPLCRGDRRMLRQVIQNLLSNSIKFTQPRLHAVISVGGVEKADEIEYFVKDNGVGFDMAYGHKLFGVFEQLHSGKEYGGSGMGLAIVKRIILRHGGRVWAEGWVNEGAVVHFALPRKE